MKEKLELREGNGSSDMKRNRWMKEVNKIREDRKSKIIRNENNMKRETYNYTEINQLRDKGNEWNFSD